MKTSNETLQIYAEKICPCKYLPTTNQMPHQLDYWDPPSQLFLSWDSIKGWNWANLDSALINGEWGLYP